MNQMVLTEEDRIEINAIKEDLQEGLNHIDLAAALQDMDYPIRIGKESINQKIRDKHKYYFVDELTLMFALKEFFSNPYLPTRLAKMLYLCDEDELFTESLDIDTLPLGTALGESAKKRGKCSETSTLEIEFRVLDKINHVTSKYTKLPFMIKAVRLIPED